MATRASIFQQINTLKQQGRTAILAGYGPIRSFRVSSGDLTVYVEAGGYENSFKVSQDGNLSMYMGPVEGWEAIGPTVIEDGGTGSPPEQDAEPVNSGRAPGVGEDREDGTDGGPKGGGTTVPTVPVLLGAALGYWLGKKVRKPGLGAGAGALAGYMLGKGEDPTDRFDYTWE